jgi:hypothetical protein
MVATANFHAPFMGSVTATGTASSIYTLLSAVYSNLPIRAQVVRIQSDPTNGATTLYVGNSGVATTNCGVAYSAGQVQDMPDAGANLYSLQDIYLLSGSGSIQVNLTILTR